MNIRMYWVVLLRIYGRVRRIGRVFFDDQLQRVNGKRRQLLEEWIEYSIRESRRELKMADMGEQEKYDFLILMRSMLEFRPENRPSMREVLKSGWMQK
jgi:hypothetical protein